LQMLALSMCRTLYEIQINMATGSALLFKTR
jgi:hypothetical protein